MIEACKTLKSSNFTLIVVNYKKNSDPFDSINSLPLQIESGPVPSMDYKQWLEFEDNSTLHIVDA